MLPLKRLVALLIIFLVSSMALCVYAQEPPAYMYLKEQPKKAESDSTFSDTIYTGTVILYGELVPPPYIVEFKNDTAWINHIPFNPPIQIWTEPKQEVPESYRGRSELEHRLYQDFIHLLESHDEAIACTLLVHRYLPDTSISRISFGNNKRYIPSVHLVFTDGHVANLTAAAEKLPSGKIQFLSQPAPKEDMIEARRQWAGTLSRHLVQGRLDILSACIGLSFISIKEQQIFLDALRRIARGETTVANLSREEKHLLPHEGSCFWKEFQVQKDKWR